MSTAKQFTSDEWDKILDRLRASNSEDDFGLPERRDGSVVLATFNIRKLGAVKKRPTRAWEFFQHVCARFDLLAVQEVMDDLAGLKELKNRLGDDYGMVASDVTGTFPGDAGNTERLAFLFNWKRIQRTELASDISYDRSKVVNTLFENHGAFQQSWENQIHELGVWEEKVRRNKAAGKKPPAKPSIELPTFLTFIRQPHCVSFRVPGAEGVSPYEFLIVNAHLLYGNNEKERRWEFDSLLEWLTIRAKNTDTLYHKNLLLMGDCNLEFESTGIIREEIDDMLRAINKEKLKSKKAAKLNLPLLTEHPTKGVLRTNLRDSQTYDQIALFTHDKRLPKAEDNKHAGQQGADQYNYGVFHMGNLFAQALFNKNLAELNDTDRQRIIDGAQHQASDHMPAWIRLPIPT